MVGGGYAAIQCKFYDPDKSQIDKKAIDSFLSASGREFLDSQQRKCGFARRFVVTSLERWTEHAEDAIRDQAIPVTRIDLTQLQDFQVDWQELSHPKIRSSRPFKKFRGYQKEAVQKVLQLFARV